MLHTMRESESQEAVPFLQLKALRHLSKRSSANGRLCDASLEYMLHTQPVSTLQLETLHNISRRSSADYRMQACSAWNDDCDLPGQSQSFSVHHISLYMLSSLLPLMSHSQADVPKQ